MKNRKIVPTVLFLILSLIFCSSSLLAQEGQIVKSIVVEGNRRVDTSTILYYIKSEEGKPLLRSKVRRDIEQIFSLAQFKDIQVETRPLEGGVEVIFKVEEIPSIGPVNLAGNSKLDNSEIFEKINIKRGATFSDHLVQESIEEINKLYRDKGYFFAKVNIDTTMEDNLVSVMIRIKEGEKVNIEKIRFSGNRAFKDKKLLKNMETKEKTWYSFIDESGIYRKDLLKLDLLRIESFYHDHGYLQVRVLEPKIDINQKNKEIYITIPVEEGDRFRVGKIDIEGNDTLSADELRKSIVTREKEIYNESQVRNDVLSLTEIYSKKGFAYADVSPNIKIKPETKTVDISMEIDKGNKVYVGEINIAGNIKTRDNVIRREFRLKEGEQFDSEKLKRSKQRINNLQFFEDVKIDTQRGEKADLIDIVTTVTERPTGSISVGGGFSSVENLIFTGSVSQNNLFGRGQSLSFSTNLSSRRTNFNINFTEPRVFDSDILLGIDAFNRESDFFSFESKSIGGGIRLGKSLGEYNWVGLNYRFEEVEVSDVDAEDETEFLKNETRTTSRIAPTFIRDTRDNFLNPSKGWRHVVRLELAGGILGGTDFYKTGYEVSYYRPLWGKLVGAFHAELNIAAGYGGDNLPIFERYFMGGANSLRGFTIRDVGPKNLDGDPLGGDQSLLFNVELQYPFSQGFRGFVFYDRGNVYGSGTDTRITPETLDLVEMRHSIGAGIRFLSPFGPIGVAYGIKLDKQSDENFGEFHFSAGSSF